MWVFIYILFVHWFADFVLQTRHMAKRKSTSNYYLSMHVFVYSSATAILWVIFFAFKEDAFTFNSFYLWLITFVTHWVTDYITSRQTSRLFKAEKEKQFFTMIGFDQWIHAVTLFLTYEYLILK